MIEGLLLLLELSLILALLRGLWKASKDTPNSDPGYFAYPDNANTDSAQTPVTPATKGKPNA